MSKEIIIILTIATILFIIAICVYTYCLNYNKEIDNQIHQAKQEIHDLEVDYTKLKLVLLEHESNNHIANYCLTAESILDNQNRTIKLYDTITYLRNKKFPI